ncbi:MAG TPA: methyltransferase domain-containing protein [Casimicrobiaceae bacterium]|nr:methyltransferase domain-containing protein [Casimicrobiaceae bacterium]
MLGARPNLREGLICENCGLSNRNRLLLAAIREVNAVDGGSRVAILEQLSPLFEKLTTTLPYVSGSEYIASTAAPGSNHKLGAKIVRHESILGLSYASGALDLLSHNDVLEHVFDFRGALRECRRVLTAGGMLIFTCPFLMYLDGISARATQASDGTIIHHFQPEFHGDPIHQEGALTFHHFGWELMEACRKAGFREAQCGVLYDPFLGFLSSNHPDWSYGAMLPTIFRAHA